MAKLLASEHFTNGYHNGSSYLLGSHCCIRFSDAAALGFGTLLDPSHGGKSTSLSRGLRERLFSFEVCLPACLGIVFNTYAHYRAPIGKVSRSHYHSDSDHDPRELVSSNLLRSIEHKLNVYDRYKMFLDANEHASSFLVGDWFRQNRTFKVKRLLWKWLLRNSKN